MTGGGDESLAEDQGLENPGSDEVDIGRDDDSDDEDDGEEPDGLQLNENDPDPTAGASDIGGLAGGLDDA